MSLSAKTKRQGDRDPNGMNQGMQLNEGFGQTIELFRIQNVSDYLWPELQHTL